jgi:hypothetical protein
MAFRQNDIRIIDSHRRLRNQQRATVEATLFEAFSCALELLGREIPKLKVEVLVRRSGFPDWVSSGSAQEPRLIVINYNSDTSFDLLGIRTELVETAAHEMHHICRGYTIVGSSLKDIGTLDESVVSEGLADNFVVEVNQMKRFQWIEHRNTPSCFAMKVRGEELIALAKRAQQWLGRRPFSYSDWFSGRDVEPLYPRWGGYSLSYVVANNWLSDENRTPKGSASAVVDVPSRDIIAWWKARGCRLDVSPS